MKNAKVVELLKKGNIVLPLYLLELFPKFQLTLEEFIFLMYLYNQGEKFVFDPKKITEAYHLELSKVMEFISTLTEKHYLRVEVIKNEKNVMEEYINLEDFYHKLSLFIVEEVNQPSQESQTTIFEMIEREFGRTLSPMEFEIIRAWMENHISEELIQAALKEAVYNGVSNLRYIDKILYEWGKKGIKTAEDVLRHQKKYKETKKEQPEVFDYDWFEDDVDE